MNNNQERHMQLFELKSLSRRGNKQADGSYEVHEEQLGIFDSVAKAEAFIKVMIEKGRGYAGYHGFFIYEKTLNCGLMGRWHAVCHYQSVRSYLSDGTRYCYSPYDDTSVKPFRGRPEETIKLKVGVLAWYWQNGTIRPCIVSGVPCSEQKYQQMEKKHGQDLGLDYSDDCYTVLLYEEEHQHPQCWTLLPYYGTITKRHWQRLQTSVKHVEAR